MRGNTVKTYWIAVFAAVLSMFAASPALSQHPKGSAVAMLSFEFVERPAKREVPVAPYRVTFECDDNRRYRASYEPIAAEGAEPDVARAEGELTSAEWQDLQSALQGLELSANERGKLDIGYGISPNPGWEGTLAYVLDGSRREVTFTSLRPAGDEPRPVAFNRLVTLVFDLKNFALDKLQRLPARAEPPGGAIP